MIEPFHNLLSGDLSSIIIHFYFVYQNNLSCISLLIPFLNLIFYPIIDYTLDWNMLAKPIWVVMMDKKQSITGSKINAKE